MVLEKTLESLLLDCKEIQLVRSKGDQPWVPEDWRWEVTRKSMVKNGKVYYNDLSLAFSTEDCF